MSTKRGDTSAIPVTSMQWHVLIILTLEATCCPGIKSVPVTKISTLASFASTSHGVLLVSDSPCNRGMRKMTAEKAADVLISVAVGELVDS